MKALRAISTRSRWALFLGHGLTIAGQFFVIKLISLYESPDFLGRFVVVLLIYGAVQTVLFGPVTQWALRFYQEYHESERLGVYFKIIFISIKRLFFVIFVASMLVYFFVSEDWMVDSYGIEKKVIYLSFLFGGLVCLNELVATILNAAERSLYAAFYYFMLVWLRVLAVVFFVVVTPNGYFLALIWWMIFFQALLLVYALMQINSKGFVRLEYRPSADELRAEMKTMRNYVAPFFFMGASGIYFANGG